MGKLPERSHLQSVSLGLLALAQAWLPILTPVVGAIWGLYVFVGNENAAREQAATQSVREGRTRLIEAQRPFLEQKLKLYFEAAEVTGRLATSNWNDPTGDWILDDRRFWVLYYAVLAVVEEGDVASAMINCGAILLELKQTKDAGDRAEKVALLKTAALSLAHSIRDDIKRSWGSTPVTEQ